MVRFIIGIDQTGSSLVLSLSSFFHYVFVVNQ